VGGRYERDGFYADATHATWAHHTQSWRSTATAHLAWFPLPAGIVCLGAGITGDSPTAVETILENRMTWPEANTDWTVNGSVLPAVADADQPTPVEDVSTLALGDLMTFVMLGRPRTVHLLREHRTGCWKDINAHRGRTPVEAQFHTAWIDHGAHPSGDDFAYLLEIGRASCRGRVLISHVLRTHGPQD